MIYNLIAGQHLVNYLCRLSIPFVVPFICAEVSVCVCVCVCVCV